MIKQGICPSILHRISFLVFLNWGPQSYMFLWYSRKGGGLSAGSHCYSVALTLLVRWDFNAPALYINVRSLSWRNEPKWSRGNFEWNYQEMFLNGETNCQTAKESLGEEWFSPYESHFVELDEKSTMYRRGRSCSGGQVHGFGRSLGSRCCHQFCQFNDVLPARTNPRPSACTSCNPLTQAKDANPRDWKRCFFTYGSGDHRMIPHTSESLERGRLGRTHCPEKLWASRAWMFSRPVWMEPQATWSARVNLHMGRGLELDDP